MPVQGLSAGGAILLAVRLLIVLFVFGIAVGIVATALALPRPIEDVLGILAVPAGWSVVVGLFLRKAGKTWREALPFKPFNGWVLPPFATAIVGSTFLFSELGNAFSRIAPPPQWLQELMMSQFRVPFNAFVALLILAPLTEETVFRGVILGGLLGRYRARTGLLVSAALFTAFHLNPYQFPSAFYFGLVGGWIYLQTRSLWPCMIGHALMNLGPFLVVIHAFPWRIPGFSTDQFPKTVVFQPLWLDALGLMLTAFGLVWLFKTFSRRSSSLVQVKL